MSMRLSCSSVYHASLRLIFHCTSKTSAFNFQKFLLDHSCVPMLKITKYSQSLSSESASSFMIFYEKVLAYEEFNNISFSFDGTS